MLPDVTHMKGKMDACKCTLTACMLSARVLCCVC